jgi:hypothetical protein
MLIRDSGPSAHTKEAIKLKQAFSMPLSSYWKLVKCPFKLFWFYKANSLSLGFAVTAFIAVALNLLLPEEDVNEETESLAGDIADRNEAEAEDAEDPKFAHASKGESSKFEPQQNGESIDGEDKV